MRRIKNEKEEVGIKEIENNGEWAIFHSKYTLSNSTIRHYFKKPDFLYIHKLWFKKCLLPVKMVSFVS